MKVISDKILIVSLVKLLIISVRYAHNLEKDVKGAKADSSHRQMEDHAFLSLSIVKMKIMNMELLMETLKMLETTSA